MNKKKKKRNNESEHQQQPAPQEQQHVVVAARLKECFLEGLNDTDELLRALNAPLLQELGLIRCRVSDISEFLHTCKALHTLTFDGRQSVPFLPMLQAIGRKLFTKGHKLALRSLTVRSCKDLTDGSLSRLLYCTPRLETLTCMYCPRLTELFLTTVAAAPLHNLISVVASGRAVVHNGEQTSEEQLICGLEPLVQHLPALAYVEQAHWVLPFEEEDRKSLGIAIAQKLHAHLIDLHRPLELCGRLRQHTLHVPPVNSGGVAV